ncbi:hypothetical protein C8Q70DRAFT_1058314 [Cubamyces menziesii]|nr:hypothetical protein C8Q70DRAFT_1058314 [Cubamyces menziesii]
MSGDETDGPWQESKYRIVESRWQSDDFKAFMRSLDAKYQNDEAAHSGTNCNTLRTRIARAGDHVEDGYAPRGLWRNCYNQDWLRELPMSKRRGLRVVNADYDFDLTPTVDQLEDVVMQEKEDGSADEIEGTL